MLRLTVLLVVAAGLMTNGAMQDERATTPPAKRTKTIDIETLPDSRGGQDLVGTEWPDLRFDRVLAPDGSADQIPRRRVTLYRWWTDTCPYCEASLPAIELLRTRYAKRGLETVAVYHPKPPRATDRDDVLKMAARRGYRGRVAVDEDWSALDEAYLRHGPRGATSVSMLVDAKGIVRFVHPGPVLFPSADPDHARENADFALLERAIDALLPRAPAGEGDAGEAGGAKGPNRPSR